MGRGSTMAEKKEAKTTKTATKKEPAKKETVKKETEKKAVAKKTPAKKPAAKKETVKKETTKKEATVKKTIQEYMDVINWKKWEAHHMDWLYIEINAGDLLTELEAGVSNIKTCSEAMIECMLEGDAFIVEPTKKASNSLTVRYYCDNLSPERKKYSEE